MFVCLDIDMNVVNKKDGTLLHTTSAQKLIQSGAVITQSSFFTDFLTTDTPQLAREGDEWGVCCEYKFQVMFWLSTD